MDEMDVQWVEAVYYYVGCVMWQLVEHCFVFTPVVVICPRLCEALYLYTRLCQMCVVNHSLRRSIRWRPIFPIILNDSLRKSCIFELLLEPLQVLIWDFDLEWFYRRHTALLSRSPNRRIIRILSWLLLASIGVPLCGASNSCDIRGSRSLDVIEGGVWVKTRD